MTAKYRKKIVILFSCKTFNLELQFDIHGERKRKGEKNSIAGDSLDGNQNFFELKKEYGNEKTLNQK